MKASMPRVITIGTDTGIHNEMAVKKKTVANRSKLAFDVGDRIVVIDKVRPPKFYIGDEVLTEYDVRSIQLQIAQGDITAQDAHLLCITDEKGRPLKFSDNGRMVNNPHGFDVMNKLIMALF